MNAEQPNDDLIERIASGIDGPSALATFRARAARDRARRLAVRCGLVILTLVTVLGGWAVWSSRPTDNAEVFAGPGDDARGVPDGAVHLSLVSAMIVTGDEPALVLYLAVDNNSENPVRAYAVAELGIRLRDPRGELLYDPFDIDDIESATIDAGPVGPGSHGCWYLALQGLTPPDLPEAMELVVPIVVDGVHKETAVLPLQRDGIVSVEPEAFAPSCNSAAGKPGP